MLKKFIKVNMKYMLSQQVASVLEVRFSISYNVIIGKDIKSIEKLHSLIKDIQKLFIKFLAYLY